MLDDCTQNWFAVLSIIEHTLGHIKAVKPEITEAFLRSDNAGCYHCVYLILSLPSLGDRVGITIKRYDFSDPQAGKDVCDRRIAVIRSHMRRYINEGHDVRDAKDMKTAIESYGGVKGCFAAVVRINTSMKTMAKHSMTGIQSLNNFSFNANGSMKAWKAYNVGPGKLFSSSQLLRYGTPQGATSIDIVEPFSTPTVEAGVLTSTRRAEQLAPAEESGPNRDEETAPPSTEESAEVVAFCCPEEGCIKRYQSFIALQRHLDIGEHLIRPERESAYDEVKRKWAETCKQVSGGYVRTGASSSSYNMQVFTDEPVAEAGWALKKGKRATRFSDKVRSYLKDIFLQGEETGNKANAAHVASKMKSVRSADGKKMFDQSEWLAADQIARYFSRLSSLNRSGRIALEAATSPDEEEEQEEDYVTEAEEINRRLDIRRQLEL